MLESQNISELLNHDSPSLLEADSQLNHIGDVTLETSVSRRIEGGAFVRPKKGSAYIILANSLIGHKSVFKAYCLYKVF